MSVQFSLVHVRRSVWDLKENGEVYVSGLKFFPDEIRTQVYGSGLNCVELRRRWNHFWLTPVQSRTCRQYGGCKDWNGPAGDDRLGCAIASQRFISTGRRATIAIRIANRPTTSRRHCTNGCRSSAAGHRCKKRFLLFLFVATFWRF